MKDTDIKLGKYKHYKGGIVKVLFIAKNSENLEKYVVYRSLYNCKTDGKNSLWVRPLKIFKEKVKVNGKLIPRFKFIGK